MPECIQEIGVQASTHNCLSNPSEIGQKENSAKKTKQKTERITDRSVNAQNAHRPEVRRCSAVIVRPLGAESDGCALNICCVQDVADVRNPASNSRAGVMVQLIGTARIACLCWKQRAESAMQHGEVVH